MLKATLNYYMYKKSVLKAISRARSAYRRSHYALLLGHRPYHNSALLVCFEQLQLSAVLQQKGKEKRKQ